MGKSFEGKKREVPNQQHEGDKQKQIILLVFLEKPQSVL